MANQAAIVAGIKRLAKSTFIYDLVLRSRAKRAIRDWHVAGFPVPPPNHFKEALVRRYGRKYGLRVFIETGTFYGNMVNAVRKDFAIIYSIELDKGLYRRAREMFARYPHIAIIHGDSGIILERILAKIREPCLFWLDAHYSGGVTAKGDAETPITRELSHIFEHGVSRHVVLIDDARCFDGTNGYPTLDEVAAYVRDSRKPYRVNVEYDVVRIEPLS